MHKDTNEHPRHMYTEPKSNNAILGLAVGLLGGFETISSNN